MVSVIIPTYNGEEYLRTCLNCLLNQSYRNIEVFLVDDGSTDNTKSIVKDYKDYFTNKGMLFCYQIKENGGAASAVNLALKSVSGKYIMLYDVDDILYRDAIYDKVYFLENNPTCEMVYNNGYYIKQPAEFGKELFRLNKYKDQVFTGLIKGEVSNWPASYMLRSESFFKKIGEERNIYVSRYGQNLQFMLPMSYHEKVVFLDKPLMDYYVRNTSHSHSGGKEAILDRAKGYESNYVEVIKSISMPNKDTEKYLKLVSKRQRKVRLNLAFQWKDKALFNEELKDSCVFEKIIMQLKWCLLKIGVLTIFKQIKRIFNALLRRVRMYFKNRKIIRANSKGY